MGLDTVELVMEFEEEFAIVIPNAAAERIVTLRDAVDFIAAELARAGREADRDDIFSRVRRLTAEKANLDPSQIGLDDSFVEGLGLN